MPTYAELAAELLEDSASFFQKLASQNEPIRQEMTENAMIYKRLAETLRAEPTGAGPAGHPYSALAGKLLRDTAIFMKKLGADNAPIREQMENSALIYQEIADCVTREPLGTLD